MKAAITSDWHTDARFGTIARWPEFKRFTYWLEFQIVERAIDWLIVLGDYFDPGTRLDLLHAARLNHVAMRLHDACGVGSIWMPGNHDIISHSDGVSTLSTLKACAPSGMHVIETPRLVWLEDHSYFLATPFPGGNQKEYLKDWNRAVDSLKAQLNIGPMDVIVGCHHTITGAEMGTESHEMARGRDHLFPADELKAALGEHLSRATFLNGHYHKPQTVRYKGLDIQIPGSPLRFDAGERDDGCQIIFLDTETND